MAKNKKDENPQTISNVEQTLTRTEQFLEENYKTLLTGLGVIVVLVGIGLAWQVYLSKRNDEAQSQMYQAERYLEMDSLKLALNGDGNYLGFLDIAKSYKLTKSGNLALYSAGICYLHLGEYQDAIDYLNKYSKKDKVSDLWLLVQQVMHMLNLAILKKVFQNILKLLIMQRIHLILLYSL